MQIFKESPVLCSLTRNGKPKFWKYQILQDGGNFFTQSVFWQTNSDGTQSTVQVSEPYPVEPKNVGRSNETTPCAQALLEFDRDVKKQKDKGYVEIGQSADILPLPMLAHKFLERGKDVVWPAYTQPKLNGQRMLWRNGVGWSRGGKVIIPQVINHISQALSSLGSDVILDGELMLPGNVLLQESMKAIKKYTPGLSETLIYHVYDVVDDGCFSSRLNKLMGFVYGLNSPHIQIVQSKVVEGPDDVWANHKLYNSMGFEGTMVRWDKEGYQIGYRNTQLLKLKDFQDGEFKIIGVNEGKGKLKGSAIFVCDNGHGGQFNCTPEGAMSYRRGLWADRAKYIGQYLTVRYQELTKGHDPTFPVGVGFRETLTGGY